MTVKARLTQGGDGTAIASGMVGEMLTGTISGTALVSGASTNISSISLPVGIWMIYGKCMIEASGGNPSSWSEFSTSISDVSATLDLFSTTRELSTGLVSPRYLAPCPRRYVNNTGANKTIYFIAASTFVTAGAISPSAAASIFYAVRIA